MGSNALAPLAGGVASDYRWLVEELRRYTYRPGWRLSIDMGLMLDWPRLVVRYEAYDSYDPGRSIPLVVTVTIPPMPEDAALFAAWLAHALIDIEMHESREWLRRDGAIYDDPHR